MMNREDATALVEEATNLFAEIEDMETRHRHQILFGDKWEAEWKARRKSE